MTSRRAFTLIEMLVTLAVMGVVFLVVGMAVPAQRLAAGSEVQRIVSRARGKAIATGLAQAATVIAQDTARTLVALPDGRVIAERALGVDQLTGQVTAHAP